MSSRVHSWLKSLFDVEPHERLKLALLTLAFFCVIGAYTVAKELKDSVFTAVVGREFLPQARIMFVLVMIPAIFMYSKLVDSLRRYHLLCAYAFIYGALGLFFTYLLGHPTIGLANMQSSPERWFGWIFYFFVEAYSPFVVGLFWSFANSVTSPDEAKKHYALMVSGSKIGGMLTAGGAWALLSITTTTSAFLSSEVVRHQILLGASSMLLLVVPIAIYLLQKQVSGRYLHGYEAAYKVEKKRGHKGASHEGIFAGLEMFIKYPYVFGIFCIVFFYEVISTVLSYQRVSMACEQSTNLCEISTYFFKIAFVAHLVGFVVSLFGTKWLLRSFGERICLLLMPIATGLLFIYFFFSTTQWAFLSFFVILRSLHYGFSYPVRESLYIPTVKEVKFKSKSWIDAFGNKIAKSAGSFFNHLTRHFDLALFLTVESIFFGIIIVFWLIAAYLLGKRFEKAVARNEVIGISSSETN